jgi:hypothetical protein
MPRPEDLLELRFLKAERGYTGGDGVHMRVHGVPVVVRQEELRARETRVVYLSLRDGVSRPS